VLGDHREVAEDAPDREVGEQQVRLGAERALVVAVLDDQLALPPDVVVRTGLRRPAAG
jgi:hypothetical protein